MRPPFPHETESVFLVRAEPQMCADLWPVLRDAGFTWKNELWSLPRRDRVTNPQSEWYGNVSIFFEGEELVFGEGTEEPEEEEEWDKIELSYLMATLPETQIDLFVDKVEVLANALQLPVIYQGAEISAADLKKLFHSYCEFLEVEYGGAGSMTIRHFIDIHYST